MQWWPLGDDSPLLPCCSPRVFFSDQTGGLECVESMNLTFYLYSEKGGVVVDKQGNWGFIHDKDGGWWCKSPTNTLTLLPRIWFEWPIGLMINFPKSQETAKETMAIVILRSSHVRPAVSDSLGRFIVRWILDLYISADKCMVWLVCILVLSTRYFREILAAAVPVVSGAPWAPTSRG